MNIVEWKRRHFERGQDWALVTGAGAGIGLEYAKQLAAAGCDCLLVGEEADRLQAAARTLEVHYGIRAVPVACELADPRATVACCAYLRAEGYQVRVLVSAAGLVLAGRFDAIALERCREMVQVNALAPTIFAHAFLPPMRAAGAGLHVSVVAPHGPVAAAGHAVAAATQAYVQACALALAQEWGEGGIRFQVVLPGPGGRPLPAPAAIVQQSLGDVERLLCTPEGASRWRDRLARWLPGAPPVGLAR